MKKAAIIILCIFCIGSLSSCSLLMTRSLATWETENLQPQKYSKMVVYCVAPNIATRSAIERTIAKRFTKDGLESVAACDKLPDLNYDPVSGDTALVAAGEKLSADVFLILKLGSATESVTNDFMSMSTDRKSVSRVTLTQIENKVYKLKPTTILMTINTETQSGANNDIQDIAGSLSTEIMYQLEEKAIKLK